MAPALAPSSSASSPDSAATNQNQPIQKGFSCVLCAQRKVKCDKAPGGCANCTRARVNCVYKAPPPPRRRKKGVREIDVHARLRLYEDELRRLGVEPDTLVKKEMAKARRESPVETSASGVLGINDIEEVSLPDGPSKNPTDGGVLVSGDGKSRYLENTLWTSLKGEFRDSKDILEDTSSEDEESEPQNAASPSGFSNDGGSLLLGGPRSAVSLRPLHPQPVQIFKLWQAYLDNINPLIKPFHTPTVQQMISNATGNLDDVPRNVEALLFAVYSAAVESLSEVECGGIMGESKGVVGQRVRMAAQLALVNASFLKTADLMVLQALVLFLSTCLSNVDARVIWILTGVAARIGQRIGLHRDPQALGLPPFECEMRRRLWWQIIMSDGFAEKLAGTGGNVLLSDVKRPMNLNDSDLFPGMKEIPKEHEGATEMMFFLIRCHVGEFLKRSVSRDSVFDGVWNKLSTNATTMEVKDKAIDELDALYQCKFLQYCDHSVPWHYMCSYLCKAVIFMLRFIAHNTHHSGEPRTQLPQSELDMLFRVSLQIVIYQNMAYTTQEMQGYLWHINSHFQWKAFIYLLSELRYRTEGKEVENAWKQVQLVYDFHPDFSREVNKRALPIAIGNLTLKAWDAYATAQPIPEAGEPVFIRVLRARRPRTKTSFTPPPNSDSSASSLTPGLRPMPDVFAEAQDLGIPSNVPPNSSQQAPIADTLQSFQWDTGVMASLEVPASAMADFPPLDPEQMSWSNWDDLLADFQMEGAGGFGADLQGLEFGMQ